MPVAGLSQLKVRWRFLAAPPSAGKSNRGDLRMLFSGFFDAAGMGSKLEAGSYRNIAETCAPSAGASAPPSSFVCQRGRTVPSLGSAV